MKKALLVLLLYAAAGMAASVSAVSVSPAYGNARQNITVLTVTITASDTPLTVYAINVTLAGAATPGNITAIRIMNGTQLFGTNTTWTNYTNRNTTLVNFSSALSISANQVVTLSVVLEPSSLATPRTTAGLSLTSVADIAANITPTSSSFPISGTMQLQDLHASATISPRYVDTNMTNQTFVYTITPSGQDQIRDINITLPEGYTGLRVVNISRAGSPLIVGDYTPAVGGNSMNVTFTTPTSLAISINFTTNTNLSDVPSRAFNATISGANLSGVLPDIATSLNVTTRPLLNVTAVKATKNAAYLNGTDYWEFNFTINVSSPVALSGMLHMKMRNWADDAGNTIGLSNSTMNLATLRTTADFNTTNKLNISNEYDYSQGVLISANQDSPITVVLRMVVPTGVAAVSSSWATTYGMLFRASP